MWPNQLWNFQNNAFGYWSTDFTKAFQEKWPNWHQSRYKEVKVLLVQWGSDDMDLSHELRSLGIVFRREYGFNVSCFKIQDERPAATLTKRVLAFIDNSSETLHMFLYSEHGSIHEEKKNVMWVA